MQVVKLISVAAAVACVITGSASAQQRPTTPAPLRGYLIGGGGTSIDPNQSATLTFEIAENVHPDVQVYAAATFFDNLMSQDVQDQLAAVAQDLTIATGAPWTFGGRDRGRAFTFGVKYLVPTSSALRPYVGGGFGALNLRRKIVELSRGDLTTSFLNQFGSADGVIDAAQSNVNKPMAEVAGGVGVVVRRAYVDFGYRWRRAFHNVGQSIDVSSVTVAAGVRF